MIVGAQLYTISNFAQDEAGIRASYQKLGEMGTEPSIIPASP